jgi:hypothetical protein
MSSHVEVYLQIHKTSSVLTDPRAPSSTLVIRCIGLVGRPDTWTVHLIIPIYPGWNPEALHACRLQGKMPSARAGGEVAGSQVAVGWGQLLVGQRATGGEVHVSCR